jgi:carboxyl-terminal processing protease
MFPFSKIRNFIFVLAVVLLTSVVSYRLGENHVSIGGLVTNPKSIVNTTTPSNTNVDFSMFWDVWQRVHTSYIEAAQIDNQKLVYGAISGMVSAIGDPYTMFLAPKDNQSFKQGLSGAFEGIGAQLDTKDNKIVVVAPLKGSPAESAGIKPGDWIIKVNDEDTLSWTVDQAVTKIRGPKGTKVNLTIVHDQSTKPVDISIVRDTITVPSIESWINKPSDIKEISGMSNIPTTIKNSDKYIAYIHLNQFGDRLEEDWTSAINDITQAQTKHNVVGMIFDLRNNPGGYLEGSVYIASEFLKSGVVVSQQNSDKSKIDYKVDRTGKLLDIPLVVLVNKGSASAAEIVSGALKDYKRATIVGETSFGKGSVQTPEDLSGGAGLHITTGKWLTPNGDWISKKGIVPDVTVKLDVTDPTVATHDAQLEKAIEILLK